MLRPVKVVQLLTRLSVLPAMALLATACAGAPGTEDSGSIENGAQASAAGALSTLANRRAVSVGPAAVFLDTAGRYAVLAKSGISTVPTSSITGDLGLSPAAASYITGFALTRAGVKWTSPQVVGSVYAADNDAPTPTALTTAVSSMERAYTDAAGRPTPTFLNLGGGAVGGLTLAPGLYKWTTAVSVSSDVTLSGAPDDVWIFQIAGGLTVSAAKRVILSGGAQAKNIFWQVAGVVDLGTTSHAEGIILSKTMISLATGASLNGRLFAQTAVTLASNKIVAPTP